MGAKNGKFLFWFPRILSIVFIIFLMLFSLDVFDSNLGFWETVLGLLIHNIPTFILIIVLIISWRLEIVGGIAFIIAGLLIEGLALARAISSGIPWYIGLSWSLIIAVPAFLIGVFFLIGWHRKKKDSHKKPSKRRFRK